MKQGFVMPEKVSELTAVQLSRLLKIRHTLDMLDGKRKALTARLEKIIHGRPGAVGWQKQKSLKKSRPARRDKRRRKGTLREVLIKVMRQAGKPMYVSEIHHVLVAKRFLTKSRNFKQLIRLRMYTDKKTFRKVKPGCFTLRTK